jgi:HTH-type transcriptional regulator/antitoxin HipB
MSCIMIYSPQQLANKIKLIRTSNNWSQADIAKKVGIKQSTLSNFENDPDRCQLQTVFKILQGLHLHMELLEQPQKLASAPDDENW